MRNIVLCLSLVGVMLFSVSCGKENALSPNGDAHAQLITATYTQEKIEGSHDGVKWMDYTLVGTREVLALKPQNTYSSATLVLSTGAMDDVFNGTWALSKDGNTLALSWGSFNQSYTIISLTPTTLVLSFQGFNINSPWSSAYYPQNRVTYKRS